jgi:hypothetical protein
MEQKKRGLEEFSLPALIFLWTIASAQKQVLTAGPIGQNGVIDDLSTGAALPCVKHPHKVIEFLGIHAAFAFRAFHGFPLTR